MNKRQQKEYDKITKFLEQFGAKIKDGAEYIHSELPLTISNKYDIEHTQRADSVKRISKKSKYWTFDGVMCDRERKELQIIKEIAESKGGKLLSTIYVDCEKNLEFLDKDGNLFKKPGKEIKNNKWSPYESKRVYNNPEYHLNELTKIAESKGGRLISTEYINTTNKLEVEDKYGNRFWMSSSDLKRNHWSPYEQGQVVNNPLYHLNELRKIAESKGGKVISTEYINAHAKLEFEDSEGRRFFMAATDVKSNRWSGYESGNVYNNPEYHLNELTKIAESKGGKLISTKYINGRTKLEFEDRNKKRFNSTPNAIKRGQWSPFENVNLSEEKTRQCIELIFNDTFPSIWGVIRKSTTNRIMQLDGYNNKLKIAFEYQGEQHYSWQDCRGTTEEKKKQIFSKVIKNDQEKLKLCNEKNIHLITIKYFEKYKEDKQYLIHVINELKKHNNDIFSKYLENIENKINQFKFDYNKLPTNEKYLKNLRLIAEKKGGKLISTQYVDNLTKLEFLDENNNTFWSSPTNIKSGRWSPYISKKVTDPKYHLNQLKILAEKKGFKLISINYVNTKGKLEYEDQKGNRFFRSSSYVKQKWK